MCNRTIDGNLPFWDRRRPAGFRLWPSDAIVLLAAAAAGPVLWSIVGSPGLLLPLVVGHFFLFCNVFRVPRWTELAWAGAFLVNAGVWLFLGRFSVPVLFLAQTPLTLAAIIIALLDTDYHGLGYRLVRRLRGAGEGSNER